MDAALEGPASVARHRTLTIAAIGVVFGDIGTSPLYVMRETFTTPGMPLNETAVYGVLSLIFWSIVIVVWVKYSWFMMRADNKGEGGVLALASLALRASAASARRRQSIWLMALVGVGLFYGDALITPSVSVLSAVEGLSVATHAFDPLVVPLATFILILLFMLQSRGTGSVGGLFGPIMVVWFAVIGFLGLIQVIGRPAIVTAFLPTYAIELVVERPWTSFVALGAVFLAVTGAEALYADMGHFGRGPIRTAWLGVMVALLLNYFGQGALLLRTPDALDNPFYRMAADWALYPLVALSTVATVIASQAVISGVFSLTRQAIQLGYLPRMDIRHTSATEMGQIYVPEINWLLMVLVAFIVVEFGSSSKLTHAYGLAVTGVMVINTLLSSMVAGWLWGWKRWTVVAVCGGFLMVDLLFLASNTLKIPTGGWFPIVVAIAAYAIFSIWARGREALMKKLYAGAMPIHEFLSHWDRTTERVGGTAVFMTSNPAVVPTAFLHNLKHNHVVHERVVIMTVKVEDVPRLADAQRVEVEKLGKGFHQVIVRYGFMERPDIPRVLELCRQHGLPFDLMQTTFFLGRETIIPSNRSELYHWQAAIFIAMQATAQPATRFFRIPPNRVVEMGTQVEL